MHRNYSLEHNHSCVLDLETCLAQELHESWARTRPKPDMENRLRKGLSQMEPQMKLTLNIHLV